MSIFSIIQQPVQSPNLCIVLAAGLWARVAMAVDSKNKVAPLVMSITNLQVSLEYTLYSPLT